MLKTLFITATGTDVGKTFVSALIVKKLRELGFNCGYYKPALSGAVRDAKHCLIPGDVQYVLSKANIIENPMNFVSYVYEEAVSPHLASVRVNDLIYLDKILNDFEKVSSRYDYILVEGCGGIICPLNLSDNKLMLHDVILSLNSPTIIVADAGLGTINSTLLTIDFATQKGINVAGIILNNYDKNNFLHLDNLRQIENLTNIKVVATVSKDDSEIIIDNDELVSIFKEI